MLLIGIVVCASWSKFLFAFEWVFRGGSKCKSFPQVFLGRRFAVFTIATVNFFFSESSALLLSFRGGLVDIFLLWVNEWTILHHSTSSFLEASAMRETPIATLSILTTVSSFIIKTLKTIFFRDGLFPV